MEIININLGEIKPYKNNPRKNETAVDAVAESIKQCGYVAPIIVDENMEILAGHTRWKALKKLGKTECECVVKRDLTDEQKRKYRILDNKTNELAGWDIELLFNELDGLDFGDLEIDWGKKIDGKGNNPYTKTVNLPQYEIKGEATNVDDLCDSEKARCLISQIEQSSVSEKEKEFLRIAAYRHAEIDFEAVAEYYAAASKEMQELMEKSALVIIDYEDAIANGFAQLSGEIEKLRKADFDGA